MIGAQADKAPQVAVLMCTYNGAAYLDAQLQSLVDQDHDNWSLWVSDDGSEDATLDILRAFRLAYPRRAVRIVQGPRRGSAMNFLTLLGHPDLPAGPVAFADQDDVWMPHKLGRALSVLGQTGADVPAAYAGPTIETDASLRPVRHSSRHRRGPGFGNALVQNILGGNTIVLNAAAAALMRRTLPAALAGPGVPYHDWWIYLVLTGAGAVMTIDGRPGLYYRQHESNLLGAHQGLRGRTGRLVMLRDREYAGWIDRNVAALEAVTSELTPEAQTCLQGFVRARRVAFLRRPWAIRRLGISRQTPLGDLVLAGLALTGRV